MHLIKLSAIDSTNDYLKQLNAQNDLESFVVVTAETQTNGRGQMGSKWITAPGKNLIMSVLVKDTLTDANQIFLLNAVVATSIINALKKFGIPQLAIKWPNDILSASKKIGGILIENSFKNDSRIDSVIGIGLNVCQTDFTDLPKASSLLNVTGITFDKAEILTAIVGELKQNISTNMSSDIWENYNNLLFRKNIPTAFEYPDGNQFMGIISGVGKDGKLELQLEDDSIKRFGIKEITMLY
jgi:BirA family transcriptional regulator, biotin operon repressor / biotin---[acetyl-CoA-carboxylase] ligase